MSKQYFVDANVFLTAWYYLYPPEILSTLWEKIASQKNQIILIKPVYDEIEPISSSDKRLSPSELQSKYPLRVWLDSIDFVIKDTNNEVDNLSILLEQEYQTTSLSKGAGQVDITLIAYAKLTNTTIVTLESKQPEKPSKKSNYKIPLICAEQKVRCIDFISLLRELKIQV